VVKQRQTPKGGSEKDQSRIQITSVRELPGVCTASKETKFGEQPKGGIGIAKDRED